MLYDLIDSKLFSLSNKILKLLSPNMARARAARRVASRYDMMREADEDFFSRIYLYHIKKKIKEVFGNRAIHIFDAGCGQGRLSIPLAMDGHKVMGMDFTPEAIKLAKKYEKEKNVEIEFILGDLEKDINKIGSSKFHCVISTEVLYMIKDYKNVINKLTFLLEPGGLMFISLRPRLYYVIQKLINGYISDSHDLLINKKTYINDGFLNCLSKDEIEKIMQTSGFTQIEYKGIGVITGIMGDPQSLFAIPSAFDKKQQALLFEMELYLGDNYPENGRYIFVSGIKK